MSNPFQEYDPFLDEPLPSVPQSAFTSPSKRYSPPEHHLAGPSDDQIIDTPVTEFPQQSPYRNHRPQKSPTKGLYESPTKGLFQSPTKGLYDSPAKYQSPYKRDSPFKNSPDIFARSAAHARTVPAVPAALLNMADTPKPALDREPRTLRASYTSDESPKRDNVHVMGEPELPIRTQFTASGHSSHSERFLEPPEPIFSRETFTQANQYPKDPDTETLVLGSDRDYAYHVYQKEYEEIEGLSDIDTIGTGKSQERGNSSEFFSTSIDGNIMRNIADGFVPNTDKSLHKRKVRVVGQSGNLVLENRIPVELKKVLTTTESPFGEFTNMTYTACTAEPDDFIKEGFTLRTAKYGRETELIICVTMYNEDEHAFARTMHGIMKNVAHLCSRTKSLVWGKDAWKKVQVIIVSDGRNKINEGVLLLLTATGCYQDNLARPYVNNKTVKAHLFEYTTQISIDENLKFKGDEKCLTPVQVLFCLKEKNQKKINSHRWLFNAFCPILDPNVVVLLDVGTKPDNHAVYNMWKAFDRDSNVAGVAGEITAMKGKAWVNLTNPLVASQNFEYKMSNILDKPLESVFGYISVLPGALSAYRYIALQNHADGTGPLNAYFKGEDLLRGESSQKNSKTNFFEANMYLAEDRILCWELVSKRNENWVLKFVKLATGETDVPESVPEFLSQRRRWMNGSFFAALYSLRNANKIWQTDHSTTRKIFFCLEFCYQFVSLVFSFFSLSNFYLTFYFLTGSLISEDKLGAGGFWIFTLFDYLCISVLVSVFVASIGNRPQGSKNIFKVLMILLTVCALYALIVGLYFVITAIINFGNEGTSTYVVVSIVVSLLATYGVFILTSFLYMDPWHVFTCSLQYFLMIPTYTCTLQIFAFCNTHDVTWGTKGDNNPQDDQLNQYILEQNEDGQFEAIVVDYNIDEVYLETLYNIRAKRSEKKIKSNVSATAPITGEDYAKDVRTKVVLTWLLSNLVFIMAMLQVYDAGEINRNYYLVIILWFVAFISFFRAFGSIAYLVQNLMRRGVEASSKWSYKRKGYKASAVNALN